MLTGLVRNLKIKNGLTSAIFMMSTFFLSANTYAARGGNELKCLALNLYFETRGEPQLGKIAVGMVTLNRARSPLFGPNICGVVYARSQFSWTFDRYSDVPKAGPIWSGVLQLARELVQGVHADPTGHASHFYNPAKARPAWARKFKRTAVIGNHVFMRMPGFGPGTHNSSLASNEVNSEYLYNVSLEQVRESEGIEPFSNYEDFENFIDSLPDPEFEERVDVNTDSSFAPHTLRYDYPSPVTPKSWSL